MSTRIRLRGDTAANWTAANPVLAAREPGMETDTRKWKLGDGSTAWNALDYQAGEGGGGGGTVADLDDVPDSATRKAMTTTERTSLSGLDSALAAKAPLASPAFTGTPTGITKTHVGLGSVDNTADTAKPVSTAQQTALDAKAPLASPTFTGTVAGVTKTHVGLGNVDNTSDANKPVSTATVTALAGKASTSHTHGVTDLIATGTKDATTYLRGDNTWATPAGSSGTRFPVAVITKTGAYTAAVGDFVLANATTAGFTVTLPATPTAGDLVGVKKTDATSNVVTVVAASKTIEGDVNATIVARWAGAVFVYDGTNWLIESPAMSTQGPKGDPGTNGAPGAAATIAVGTVTTGVAGSSVAVVNAGTSSAATFNFTIPRGDKGDPGDSGTTDPEIVRDTMATALVAGSNVTITPNDGADTITIAATGGSGPAYGIGRSGFYFTMPGNVVTNLVMPVGVIVATPVFLSASTTVDRIGMTVVSVATAGGVVRLGVYGNSGMSPGSLLLDAGTIDSTTTGYKELTISQALPAGFSWLVAVAQVAQCIVNGTSTTPFMLSHTGSGLAGNQIPGFTTTGNTNTGALPGTFPAFGGNTTTTRIVVRTA